MKNENDIEIHDLAKAAYLWQVTGETPIFRDEDILNRTIFIFTNSEEIKNALNLYFCDTPTPVKTYGDYVRAVKKGMWRYKNGGIK